MAISEISRPNPKSQRSAAGTKPRVATIVMLSVILLSGLIVAGWFAGEGRISSIFAQLQLLQQQPPMWLMVPMMTGDLLAPTLIALTVVLVTLQISPQPRHWSRFIVVTVLLGLTVRYIYWRSYTLNLNTPMNGVFSIGLFGLELLMLLGSTIQLVLMLRTKDRRQEADRYTVAVLEGTFTPTVDVLIPTYDEPEFILRRTIMGCQAIDYPNKQVYLLDDTRRPVIKLLAEELGCHYITRPDNQHAKAGNLNHAIGKTHGDLIVVFDADFVPTRNFLNRTVGFFQDPTIALVQTPQSFYNADPISRNLGVENILTPEEEVFYRQIQPIRDGVGSVICSGTSFVLRRSALEATKGFVTDSLSEDYFTGVSLTAKGYRLIYLEEKLSAGLAAENIAAHAIQRLRWARGTLQAFFIDANPLTIRGLRPFQRLAHLEGLLHWFSSFPRIGYLIMPLAYSFLNVIPIRSTTNELIYYLLPFYVVQLTAFSWLNQRSRSALLSDIYSLALTFPLALTVLQVMLNPFSKGFKVTPKGTSSDRFSFNVGLAIPLIILFVLTAFSLWRNLGLCLVKGAWQLTVPPEVAAQVKGIGLGWIWSGYNLIMIAIALLILVDVPKPSLYEWFDLRRTVKLQVGERQFWGVTTMLSEAGVEVALTEAGLPELAEGENLPVTLEILEENLKLDGSLMRTGFKDEFPTVRILFKTLNLEQHRRLVEILFCRPGQWKRSETPGELQSLVLLFKILFRPRFLFDRQVDVNPISVVKV